jgi:hemoglobin-like flavoprotein
MSSSAHRVCVWSEDRLIGEVPLGVVAEDRDFIIGRHPVSDIVLPAPGVSRRHAAVQRSRGSYWLRDLGSTNGTYLNGARLIGQHAYLLHERDVIQVRPFTLLCRIPGLERQGGASPASQVSAGAATPAVSSFEHDLVVVTAGGRVIETRSLERVPVRVGAGPGDEIVLAGVRSAGTLLRIERRDGAYHLVNASAEGGVHMGGGEVIPVGAERPLRHHAWLQLGPFTLQVFLPSQLPLRHPEAGARAVPFDATMAMAPAIGGPDPGVSEPGDQAAAPAVPVAPGAVFPSLPGAEYAGESGGRPGTGFSKLVFQPGFVERFYERFLAADPEVPGYFEGVDFERQRRMLLQAFALTLLEDLGEAVARRTFQRLSELHRRLGVPRRLFDVWKECLLETAYEFSPALAQRQADRWRDHLDRIILQVAGSLV